MSARSRAEAGQAIGCTWPSDGYPTMILWIMRILLLGTAIVAPVSISAKKYLSKG